MELSELVNEISDTFNVNQIIKKEMVMKMSLITAVLIVALNKKIKVGIDYKGDTMVLKNNKNNSKR